MAIKLILAILATHRLSQLIAWDSGPAYSLKKLRDYVNYRYTTEGGIWENIDEGINCPYCLGMYFALICVILFIRPKKHFLLTWLGVAGGQAFLQGLTKGR